ncbi:helix-turn-helix domain-containing protein [Billgrantia montanilacus]|uniref:Crp/Fnr family transcriptional regulator n=1 Tax=Billgrantia montanilacus TaxID=2282305 RepID=A0A368U070_9GAMM|nr:helix-turn-helix domain-containing protein [Halomonas montanilacus]RCV89462.1 Crp/Fnr family transcriptional regulator [Halomonas montanilacus]
MTSSGKTYTRDSKGLSCLSCHAKPLCLAAGLPLEEMAQLSDIVRPAVTLAKRDTLATQGAAFDSLFAVRTGSLKQVVVTDSDEYLVTALWLPGELIGLDAIGKKAHPGSLVALETTTVCEIPFGKLDELCGRSAEVRWRFQHCLSHEMYDERLRLHLLLRRTAEVRLACFIMAISERFRLRGFSPHHFRLAMSRSDMASYLGLTPETVGRTLVKYQRQNLLLSRGREFEILDLERMKRLAEANGRRHGQRFS